MTAERPREEDQEAGVEAAPEGASEPGRPDSEDDRDESLGDEGAVRDPDPEQADPESGPAADPY